MSNIKLSELSELTSPSSNTQKTYLFVTDTSTGTATSKKMSLLALSNTITLSGNTVNAASNTANAAFLRANNSLSANNGGVVTGSVTVTQNLTVSGDASITGNLYVMGNTFSVNAGSITSSDTLLVLGLGNYSTDILDIGFAGHYNNGTNAHSGLLRDAGTKEWYLFKEYVPDISPNNNIVISDPTFLIDTLNANLKSNSVLVQSIDILNYANIIFNTANAAFLTANAGGGGGTNDVYARNTSNSAFIHANAAFDAANAGGAGVDSYARNTGNAAFLQANAAYVLSNTQNANIQFAWDTANAAFLTANAGGGGTIDTYARNTSNASFNSANAAFLHANAAFIKANTGTAGQTRTSISTTTISLAANATANATVAVAKGYALYKIQVSTGAWVTLYGNTALANVDFTRSITTDPAPGSGVIAESITSGTAANVTYFTPAVIGYNDDVAISTNAYLKVYNNSGTTNTVNVTLTFLTMES
jgi:hypothetical protein